jgi:hypothetical protein
MTRYSTHDMRRASRGNKVPRHTPGEMKIMYLMLGQSSQTWTYAIFKSFNPHMVKQKIIFFSHERSRVRRYLDSSWPKLRRLHLSATVTLACPGRLLCDRLSSLNLERGLDAYACEAERQRGRDKGIDPEAYRQGETNSCRLSIKIPQENGRHKAAQASHQDSQQWTLPPKIETRPSR